MHSGGVRALGLEICLQYSSVGMELIFLKTGAVNGRQFLPSYGKLSEVWGWMVG